MKDSTELAADIRFSDSAKQHLLAELQSQTEHSSLRLSLKKTGCSGLSYVVDYVTAPQEGDRVTHLTKAHSVYVDKAAYPFLKGTLVDYVTLGINKKLVFSNPNQTGECGCGESFTVE